MAERTMMELANEEILRDGLGAHRKGEGDVLEACLYELGHRTSRRAAAVEAELRALPPIKTAARARPRGVSKSGTPRPDEGFVQRAERGQSVEFLKDEQIKPRREELIREARRSVWLSSLTFPYAELVDVLAAKARGGVDVTLIVAERQVRGKHETDLQRLEKAGVECVFLESTHSKLLVIDDEYMMVGSANAHGGHRDACTLNRNRALAIEAVEYLGYLRDRA